MVHTATGGKGIIRFMSTYFANPAELEALLRPQLPGLADSGISILHAGDGEARVRQAASDQQLRPGGTLSGPTMMALADTAMYAAILGTVGPELLAVTTDMNMHFLRRPAMQDLEAHARIIKLGQRLIVCTVEISSGEDLVAHATGSYVRPPAGKQ